MTKPLVYLGGQALTLDAACVLLIERHGTVRERLRKPRLRIVNPKVLDLPKGTA